jgi:heterodisulfide reductase subunit D
VQEAFATDAGGLVSACQQCEQVLEQAARTLGARLRVADVVELLEADLEGGE